MNDLRGDLISILYQFTFDPGTSVLSSILHSGKLDLIESEQLRVDLASWPSRYQDLSEEEQAISPVSVTELQVHYDEYLAFRDINPELIEDSSRVFTLFTHLYCSGRRYWGPRQLPMNQICTIAAANRYWKREN